MCRCKGKFSTPKLLLWESGQWMGWLLQLFVPRNRRRAPETALRPKPCLNVVGQWLLWHVALVWSGLLMRLKESGRLNGW